MSSEKIYIYRNEAGNELYRKITTGRGKGKKCRFSHPDANGKQQPGRGCDPVPYNLDKLAANQKLPVDKRKPLLFLEGEPDCMRAEKEGLGYIPTTLDTGANSPFPTKYIWAFEECQVAFSGDNDPPGRSYIQNALRNVRKVASANKLLELPNLAPGGDLDWWFDQKNTKNDFYGVVTKTEPWTPTQERAEPAAAAAEPAEDEVESTDKNVKNVYPEIEKYAFHGIAGDVAGTLEPYTEADPAAMLFLFLGIFAATIGRGRVFVHGTIKLYLNLFILIIGKSSKARKGTAWNLIEDLFKRVDLPFIQNNVCSGVSTLEGLAYEIRDEQTEQRPVKEGKQIVNYQTVVTDPGVKDKRRFIIEEEHTRIDKAAQRDGNPLTEGLRQAADGKDLQVINKNSPVRAKGGHICLAGMTTEEEFSRVIDPTNTLNGFYNRYLMVFVRRTKLISHGEQIPEDQLDLLSEQIKKAVEFGQESGAVEFDYEASELWRKMYPEITEEKPGTYGAVTGRAESHIFRLSALYAILDLSGAVRPDHLKAALAAWDYCDQTARYIFGDSLNDHDADKILQAVRSSDEGLSKTEIREQVFFKRIEKERLDRAIHKLTEFGLIQQKIVEHEDGKPGRKKTVFY